MRSVPEWIGDTPDARIPDRVRVRVFQRYEGRCQCSPSCQTVIRPPMKWQCDHTVALINGGAHAESNLAPVLTDHHKVKTARDVAVKSKTYRMRAKHLGIKKPRSFTRWRNMRGDVVTAPRER